MDLNKQSKSWNIVIRKNKYIDIKKLESYLCNNTDMYAFIKHEGDKNPETGEIEGVHYHIVCNLPKRKRAYTILNEITNVLGFDNNHGVEIEVLKSLEGSIQYFCHKNDKDKTPHKLEEIKTSMTLEELQILFDSEESSLTLDRILYYLSISNDLIDLISHIGFVRYNMYRNTIKDIIECYRNRKKLPF